MSLSLSRLFLVLMSSFIYLLFVFIVAPLSVALLWLAVHKEGGVGGWRRWVASVGRTSVVMAPVGRFCRFDLVICYVSFLLFF